MAVAFPPNWAVFEESDPFFTDQTRLYTKDEDSSVVGLDACTAFLWRESMATDKSGISLHVG